MRNAIRNPEFQQVCVWPGTIVEPHQVADFEAFVKQEMGARVQFLEIIHTFPDVDASGAPVEDTGGRSDVFFAVHKDDIGAFAVKRLAYGIRWFDDAVSATNGGNRLYPPRVMAYACWEPSPAPEPGKPKVKLVGEDGNAFAILSACQKSARKAGWSAKRIEALLVSMRSGDYDHLLRVAMENFDVA